MSFRKISRRGCLKMESLMMINYWISGNLLLDKSNMFEANHSIIVFSRIWNFPPSRWPKHQWTRRNRPFTPLYHALSTKTHVLFQIVWGHPLNSWRTAGLNSHSAAESTSSGIESTAFFSVEASESPGQPSSQLAPGTKGDPPRSRNQIRKKACNRYELATLGFSDSKDLLPASMDAAANAI